MTERPTSDAVAIRDAIIKAYRIDRAALAIAAFIDRHPRIGRFLGHPIWDTLPFRVVAFIGPFGTNWPKKRR